jgi:hypothetical protein
MRQAGAWPAARAAAASQSIRKKPILYKSINQQEYNLHIFSYY